ncbi:hypothetical protein [Dactylosporangium sp. CA-139066]|uniref:hypothetical protein n=1 Tax=Dactylosporangium sp. CA-139066 TaxID=3239930 RepID=UPI003D8F2E5F
MKGKHSQAAAVRRDVSAIESERDSALARAVRAETALAEQRERAQRESETASRELRMLREAATEATSPETEDLRLKLERARRYAEALEDAIRSSQLETAQLEINIARALMAEYGLSSITALGFIAGVCRARQLDRLGPVNFDDGLTSPISDFDAGVRSSGPTYRLGLGVGMGNGEKNLRWREDGVRDEYREFARQFIAAARSDSSSETGPRHLGPLTLDVARAAAGVAA